MQLDGILSGLNPKHKVFILGSAVVDLVLSVNRLPKSGEDISAAFQGGKVGGCAFNVADVLTKLDLPCSTYFPVGEGMFAQIVKQEFIKRSIAISQVCNCGDNGWNLSLVEPDGERTFITMSGLECRMQKQWFDKYSFSDFDYFYLSGYQAEGENGENLNVAATSISKSRSYSFDTEGATEEPATVQGNEATVYQMETEDGDKITVLWTDMEKGWIVRVTGYNISKEDMLRISESVEIR